MLTRVSHIEAYRRWRDWTPLFDGDEEPTLEQLVQSITSDEPSEKMLAGTAFHKALELAQSGEYETLSAEGYRFTLPDAAIELPAIREIRAERSYGSLIVSGKADGVLGKTVIDHKTTSRIDFDRYLEGYQWRFYLELFGADEFCWNLFQITETAPRTYRVAAPQVLKMPRYPEIARDCEKLAAEYLAFARQYLPADFDPLAAERMAA
jgi:hypothetical protein